MTRAYVDCFGALPAMRRREQRDTIHVGRAVALAGRFSCFEASANDTIARTMTVLCHNGWFDLEDAGYPWTKVTLTAKGRAALGMESGR
jgi:hypothetical protein